MRITSGTAAREVMTRQRIFSGFYAGTAMIGSTVEMGNSERKFSPIKPKGPYDQCPQCRGWKAKKAPICRDCKPRVLVRVRRTRSKQLTANDSRKDARRLYPDLERCERCGATSQEKRLERHHRDGNPFNNSPTNIQPVCRRCHMALDGRLARLRETALANSERARKDPTPCVECGKLSKPLRRGLCHACNERKRRAEKRRSCHDDIHAARLHL